MQATNSNSIPNTNRTFSRSLKGSVRRTLGTAAVLCIAWLPAQNAAAINKQVSDKQGAWAMSVCMLEEGSEMRMNGDQVVCCTERFCVACKDDEFCRVWSNKLDSRLPRPEHSGGTTNATDPLVAPSQKDRDHGAAPEAGVVSPSHKRRDHRTVPQAGAVERYSKPARR